MWENYSPELRGRKREQAGADSLILAWGLMEMMKLLAHGLRNMVHFQDNQTTASLSTSLTWFAKEIIDDSHPSFEVAVVFQGNLTSVCSFLFSTGNILHGLVLSMWHAITGDTEENPSGRLQTSLVIHAEMNYTQCWSRQEQRFYQRKKDHGV